MLNMTLFGCPVGFSEEIGAVLKCKNLKLTTKVTKIRKFPFFKTLTHFFPKNLTDFVNWNIEKGQQGKSVLSSMLFRRVYCNFLSENV